MTGGVSSGRRNRRSRLRSIPRGGVEGMRRRRWLLREVVGLVDFWKRMGDITYSMLLPKPYCYEAYCEHASVAQ